VNPSEYVQCAYCGNYHRGVCALIKSIEYFPDGTVKHVEFHGAAPVDPYYQPRKRFSITPDSAS